jgi:hypothetical protein
LQLIFEGDTKLSILEDTLLRHGSPPAGFG